MATNTKADSLSADFRAQAFEIVSFDTHRYSSTAVSGGGQRFVGGRIEEVQSTTELHSEQSVWVRDLNTDKEQLLEFPTGANIAARPGHKLVVVWYVPENRIERIINTSTDAVFSGGGIYNKNIGEARDRKARGTVMAGLITILCAVPITNVLAAVFLIAPLFLNWADRASNTRAYAMRNLILVVAYIVMYLVLKVVYSGGYKTSNMPYAITSFLILPLIFVNVRSQEANQYDHLMRMSAKADEFAETFMRENAAKL